MQRCPNCRARRDETPICRRCGMDLTLIDACERAADHWLGLGIDALLAGEQTAAINALNRSLSLKAQPLAQALLGFTSHCASPGNQRTEQRVMSRIGDIDNCRLDGSSNSR